MKIISLKMQAFGPFKNEEYIDFSKLGDKGIYLISGNTGSGKTSIFDAISFALFGSSSGGNRSDTMLRFISADAYKETFVELEFSYNRKKYKIKRIPSYERAKKRGEGTTTQPHSVALTIENGNIISDTKEVNDYIKKLLQIDANQFSQIIMLAQGNFMKLLKANNDEKVELFRHIFSTQKYQVLETYIGEKYRDKKAERDRLFHRKEEIYNNLNIPKYEFEKFEEVKKYGASNVISFVESIIDAHKDKSVQLQGKIKEVEENYTKLNTIHSKVLDYHKTKNKINIKKNELFKVADEFQNVEIKYKKIDDKEKEKSTLQEDIRNLRQDLEKFGKLENINKAKKSLISIKEENNKQFLELMDNERNFKKLLLEYEVYIKDNENVFLEKERLENNLENKLNKSLDILTKIMSITEKIDKNICEKKAKNKIYEELKIEIEILKNDYENLERIFFESQVGLIAQTLEENKPCPVCGSTQHPNIYVSEFEIPNENKVKSAKIKYEDKREKFNRLKNNMLLLNNSIESDIKIKNELILELKIFDKKIDIESIQVEKDNLELKIESVKKEIKNLSNIIEKIEKCKTEMIDIKAKTDENNKKIEKNKEESIRVEEQIKSLENQEQEEKANLKDLNKENLNKNMKLKENSLIETETFIKVVREDYQNTKEKYTSLKAEVNTLESELNEEFNKNEEDIKTEIESLENEKNNLRAELESFNILINQNLSELKKLKEIVKRKENLKKEYKNYGDLYNVIRGQLTGTEKIRFETFVQITYFEEVLIAANKRFFDMTEGKFSLKRKAEASNRNKQTGLEFELIDHYNKTTRDVNTLSGGESFQASLSLALGLSDVVQSKAGGIKLDSMFVDEGFGTLDAETLSKVMKSLMDISQYNKLIGIISHVDTLKSQIDKQIIVTKNNEGYSQIDEVIY